MKNNIREIMQKYNNNRQKDDVCKLYCYSFLIFRGMSNKTEVSQVFSAYLVTMLLYYGFYTQSQ